MLERIVGVLTFKRSTFQEIEKNSSLLPMAALVVLISAIGAGIGHVSVMSSLGNNLVATIAWTFVGWLLFSVVIYVIGVLIFKGKAGLSEIMRLVGFAYAPMFFTIIVGLLAYVGIVLGMLSVAFAAAAMFWFAVTLFVAVQEGLDLSMGKTFVIVAVSLFFYLIGLGVVLQYVG
jgi:hypothetical protein